MTIDHATAIERRMVGMNTWIRVTYDSGGEAREALFLDRRMLGWKGILGGNDTLLAALQEALQPN